MTTRVMISADVAETARIGDGSSVWHLAHLTTRTGTVEAAAGQKAARVR